MNLFISWNNSYRYFRSEILYNYHSLLLLSKLSALHKVGAPLVLCLVSLARLFHNVDLFAFGVDSIRLYMHVCMHVWEGDVDFFAAHP